MDTRLLGLLDPMLFSLRQRAVVVARIRHLPIRAAEKRSLYAAWLLRVDAAVTMEQLDDVAQIDRDDPDSLADTGRGVADA